MESDILIEFNALDRYIVRYKENANQYKDEESIDEQNKKLRSERNNFIYYSKEWRKIIDWYSVLKNKLKVEYPNNFSYLTNPDVYGGIKELEELSREVESIILTLERFENRSRSKLGADFSNFEQGGSINNTPFNQKEKEEIKIRLGEIENQIVEVIENQKNVPEETKQEEKKIIKEKVADLTKFSETDGRNQWRIRLESFAINVVTTLMFSGEARATFITAVYYLFYYLYQIKLYLPEHFSQQLLKS